MADALWKAFVAVEVYIQHGIVEQLRAAPKGFGGGDMKPVHDAYRIFREESTRLPEDARVAAEVCLQTAQAGLNACLSVLSSFADGRLTNDAATVAFDHERNNTLCNIASAWRPWSLS